MKIFFLNWNKNLRYSIIKEVASCQRNGVEEIVNWKRRFQALVLERGNRYYKENRVQNFRYEDEEYRARIIGSASYNVEIKIKNDDLVFARCSCPHAAKGNYFENPDNHIIYDYIACKYPNDVERDFHIYYFNHDEIDRYYSFGYTDDCFRRR